MNEDSKPPLPHEDPEWGGKQTPRLEIKPVDPVGVFSMLAKVVIFLLLGIIVMGGLVFATCLLSFRP